MESTRERGDVKLIQTFQNISFSVTQHKIERFSSQKSHTAHTLYYKQAYYLVHSKPFINSTVNLSISCYIFRCNKHFILHLNTLKLQYLQHQRRKIKTEANAIPKSCTACQSWNEITQVRNSNVK